jgi:iron complex outermembrane recepter protein
MKHIYVAALCAAFAPAWAQTTQAPVLITGNPMGGNEVATPTSVLAGTGLVMRRGSSLGETLDGLPGVSSTYFGPNANRPVIRGQDGDRIRVLSNAGAALDASSLSFDHAVPIDPLVVERIEVLRGPAALLYGGSAVGGVVNTIDNRIPKTPLSAAAGAAELRLGGANRERSASVLLEAGGKGLAFHVDAFRRSTADLHVPAFERPLDDGSNERRSRIVNSSSRASGGAVGASWVSNEGYLGASVDSYRNDYGIVAEDDITIQMRRDKVSLAGELRRPTGFITTWRAQAASTDYAHLEIEGDGSVGTSFKSRGSDMGMEAVHRSFWLGGGRIDGVFGTQFESSRFSALGEEAFVPASATRHAAVFVLERWRFGAARQGAASTAMQGDPSSRAVTGDAGGQTGGQLSAGLRVERVRVRSDGDANAAVAQFGPRQARSFAPRSASVGAVLKLSAQWQASSSWSYTERAPTHYELYANGVHAATATYERGDPRHALERGRSVDAALAWRQGGHRAKLSLFESRFSNYIKLAATGEPDFQSGDGGSVPVFAFVGVRARLYGLEADAAWRLLDGQRSVDLDVKLDLVRGQDLTHSEPLPRLAPRRLTLGASWTQGRWQARAELQRSSRQGRVPSGDTATAGSTLLNLSASYSLSLGERPTLVFAKLHNAGDVLAYSASTTATLRPLAPLPGRSLMMGMRLAF